MSRQVNHKAPQQKRCKSVHGDRPDSWDSMEGLLQQRKVARSFPGGRTALGALFVGMYHELSNPLANIRLAAEVLLEDFEEIENEGSLDSEYLKLKFSGIVREVDRAGTLLRELAQLARVKDLDMEWVNLRGLLEGASTSMQLSIPPRVRVSVEAPENLHVRCDGQMLTTAFRNLISDAVAAVGDEGEVSLEARMDSDDAVAITVANSGSALPEHALDDIFEPFFSTRTIGRGKGLGLFVPFEIVKNHNGSIWIEPLADSGTVIGLRLPAKRVE